MVKSFKVETELEYYVTETEFTVYSGTLQSQIDGKLDQKTIGIADNNLVEIDDTDAADNDYAKFTANGLEGRSYSEVRTDLGVANGADVTGSNPPQAHASSHAVGGSDTVFPADPGADRYLMWDDDPGALVWADVSAAAKATVSDSAPGSPSAGDLWWNSEEGSAYIYYTDADTSQWVTFTSRGVKGEDGVDGVTDHTLLSNIGTNAHSTIDTHLGSTSNPHTVAHSQLSDKGTNAHSTIDSHLGSTSNPHTVAHSQLSDKGTNAHSVIDTHLGSTSNPHSVDAADVNCLAKTNTTSFTPSADYHPATKKYVDDAIDTDIATKEDQDHTTGTTYEFARIVFGTSATPPTATTVPRGTIYVQYTA